MGSKQQAPSRTLRRELAIGRCSAPTGHLATKDHCPRRHRSEAEQYNRVMLEARRHFPGAETFQPAIVSLLQRKRRTTMREIAAVTGLDLLSFWALVGMRLLEVDLSLPISPDCLIKLSECHGGRLDGQPCAAGSRSGNRRKDQLS